MAQNKFENSIKEKFDKRTLKPSADAWDRLSERLDAKPKKKNNNAFWWLGLAASIVGVLLVSTFFLKNESNEVINPIEIVDTPKAIEGVKESSKNQETTKVAETAATENKLNIKDELSIRELEKQNLQKSNQTAVAKTNQNSENGLIKEINKPTKDAPEELTFEEQKVQDVIARIQTLNNGSNEVTDADVEALLLAAQKEIDQNRLYDDNGKVDAELLLANVEAEIDQSFREKVFEALKDGFITVKSAVANRND
ncbi:hypothetical protein KO566_04845 [Flavobacteriaceae bacterium XHP0103]|uniref:hypothetical protein n=1 Tax=Marixanthotalea marina TaxID=2844359 RepID=UPI002989AF6B|nr:hypothetical protein [Marixanthotalea marina]MBU3821379.1 hypothetical protein [Marixanthotalea marina]